MIIVVSRSTRANDVCTALSNALGMDSRLTSSIEQTLPELRTGNVRILVIDDAIVDTNPQAVAIITEACETALPIFVKLSIHNVDRIVQEVKAYLRRHAAEETVALRSVEVAFRNELSSSLTSILLSTDFALGIRGVPAEAAAHLQNIRESAEQMRLMLEKSSEQVR